MDELKVYDLNEIQIWKESLNKLPIQNQDIYFIPEYLDVYEQNGDGKVTAVIYKEKDNIIVYPFLEREIPANNNYKDITTVYGYGGFTSSNCDENFIRSFRKCFNDYCLESNIVSEFIRFHPLLSNQNLFNGCGELYFNRKTVVIDLSKDIDELFKEFHSQNRSDIRKALKNNLEILMSNDQKDIDCFIDYYYQTMNKNDASGYYYFSKEYFKNLFKKLDKNVYLLNAIYENKVIASAIFMGYKEYFHYHLAASNYEYQKLRPANFIIFKAIEFAQANNYRCLHLGGGASAAEDDNLLRFKRRFSNTYNDFYVGTCIHNKAIYDDLCSAWSKNNPDKVEKYKDSFFFPLYRA